MLTRAINLLLILTLLLTSFNVPSARAQTLTPAEKAAQLLAQLTPAERVGQLMLVTFQGTQIGAGSPIYNLITQYHIGGVILRRDNDNFIAPATAEGAWALINELQRHEWQSTFAPSSITETLATTPTTPSATLNYIPLFIGINQEGGGFPNNALLNGLTPLPNQMAIGATWNTDLARQVGATLGSELNALGFNLLLGPSLDILEEPNPDGPGDLGTRTFGGDPFWVGEMAKAFTTGLHQGSAGRMVVVGKYFPGRGSSDRAPDEEVATIRKSLEQLTQIELQPFFAVTGNAPTPEARVDALLTSHIRYKGFQGDNIRTSTPPISFAAQALGQLLALPALARWHSDGGLLISDDLGSLAVRRFYDPSGQNFNARFVARDALNAGNDLLYLGNILGSADTESYATIIRIHDFFVQKYKEDSAFAQKVDNAVLRILTLKYQRYPEFDLTQVQTGADGLTRLAQGDAVAFEVARQAATLISPPLAESDTALPGAPGLNDRIVFFTDSESVRQCSTCPEQTPFATDALLQTVLQLYGPESAAQVTRRNLSAYSFAELRQALEGGKNTVAIETAIRNANWLVFSALVPRVQSPDSLALRRFLAERPDLLRGKRIIVFAFDAPYFLDTTDIAKLTAYYGLYSKQPQFIEIAARLLFDEIRPLLGSSPVSIEGTGYDLIVATSPNPAQIIRLESDLPSGIQQPTPTPATASSEPPPLPEQKVGDLLALRTSILLDQNNHIVPDGTPVRFIAATTTADGRLTEKEYLATTVRGVARVTLPIETPGILEIRAQSEPAVQSEILRMVAVGQIATATPQPSATATEAPTVTPEIIAITQIAPNPTPTRPPASGLLLTWLVAVLAAFGASWAVYQTLLYGSGTHTTPRRALRSGLSSFIGGMIFYGYVIGTQSLLQNIPQPWNGGVAALIGALIGLAAVMLWGVLARVR